MDGDVFNAFVYERDFRAIYVRLTTQHCDRRLPIGTTSSSSPLRSFVVGRSTSPPRSYNTMLFINILCTRTSIQSVSSQRRSYPDRRRTGALGRDYNEIISVGVWRGRSATSPRRRAPPRPAGIPTQRVASRRVVAASSAARSYDGIIRGIQATLSGR